MASTPAMHWHNSKFLILSECIQMFEVFNANNFLLPNTLIVPHFFQYPCINKMLFCFLIFSEYIQMYKVFNVNPVLLPNTLIVPHFFQYPCINKMLFCLYKYKSS